MGFFNALQFLTTISLPWRRSVGIDQIARSSGYFPLIGLVLGLILVGLNLALGIFLPPALVKMLLIVTLVVLGGAMHLEGFIDTCDGIGGQKTPEERWQVMKDSRTGAFGVIGGALILLVKYTALSSVPERSLATALVMMPVLSRWSMVYSMFSYRYAKPSGMGKIFKESTRWWHFVIATVVTIIIAFVISQLSGIMIMVSIWIVITGFASYLRHKFAGLTGDTYGAINEVVEVASLIVIVLFSRIGLL